MEPVQFHFDPRCPWCFQASRWIRRLAELGVVQPTWSLYCLELSNLSGGQAPVAMGTTARSATALRTAAAIGLATGSSDGIGAFYQALGDRVWLTSEPAADRDQAVRESAVAAGFDAELLDQAMADPGTWEEVMRQHYWLADARHGVGVPSLVLDGGSGAEIFGPVLSHLPSDDDALAIWDHVRWLARYDNFYELKRYRTHQPDLPGWKVPASRLTFGSRPWMPPVPDAHVPTDPPAGFPAPAPPLTLPQA